MTKVRIACRAVVVGAVLAASVWGISSVLRAEAPPRESGAGQSRDRLQEPIYRVAQAQVAQAQKEQQTNTTTNQTNGGEAKQKENADQPADKTEHPLEPALKIAKTGLDTIDRSVHDYSCTLVKRERIKGKLLPHEYIFTKVRHRPFSVYMYFRAPDDKKGREVIYVEGKNDGKLIAHEAGGIKGILPRVKLEPTGTLAMADNRYPVTEVGVRNLTSRLLEVGEHDKKFGECEVKFFNAAKVDGRVCTCLHVAHPVPRTSFRFHVARIFIDDEKQVPIRFESYDWPAKRGGAPVLLEEYTYMDLKLNVGLKDVDFDPDNPNYNFR